MLTSRTTSSRLLMTENAFAAIGMRMLARSCGGPPVWEPCCCWCSRCWPTYITAAAWTTASDALSSMTLIIYSNPQLRGALGRSRSVPEWHQVSTSLNSRQCGGVKSCCCSKEALTFTCFDCDVKHTAGMRATFAHIGIMLLDQQPVNANDGHDHKRWSC